ncbi:MAG: hypothetical protein AAFZ15_02140 [Bacteroidota bacterium]
MNTTNSVKLLKTLAPAEFKQFSKFIRSPYFNTNPYLIKYYDLLKKYYPAFDSPKLEKQVIFKKLYPDQKFNDTLMRKVNSLMKKHIETFLALQNLERRSFLKKYLLADEYGQRNDYGTFEKKINQLLEEVEKNNHKDNHYFLKKFWLHKAIHSRPETFKNTNQTIHIKELDKNLNYYFAATKLKFGSELLNREKILSEDNKVLFLNDITSQLEKGWGLEHPLLEIYYLTIKLLRSREKDKLFTQLKNKFLKHINFITASDQQAILLILINYTMSVYYEGKGHILREQLDLYKNGLAQNLLVKKERITDQSFLNIVTNAAILKEFSWLEQFIKKYNQFLENKNKADILQLCEAYKNFHQKKYITVNKILQTFLTNDSNLTLRSRFLLIMNQCELLFEQEDLYETLEYQISAFEKYIRRNKYLPESRKKQFLHFAKYTKKIAQQKTSIHKPDWGSLYYEIKKQNELVGKHWLIQKCIVLKR